MKMGPIKPIVINEIAVQNCADLKRAAHFRYNLIDRESSSGSSKALMIAILAIVAAAVLLGGGR